MALFSSVKKLSFPVKGPCHITQGYGRTGYASSGVYGGGIHNGIDIAGMPEGTPVYPVASGKILAHGSRETDWGFWLLIKHKNGLYSLYGHLRSPSLLSVGDRVCRNTIIGGIGNTGRSTGAHLHLSVFRKDPGHNAFGPLVYREYALNPLEYLHQKDCDLSLADLDPATCKL